MVVSIAVYTKEFGVCFDAGAQERGSTEEDGMGGAATKTKITYCAFHYWRRA